MTDSTRGGQREGWNPKEGDAQVIETRCQVQDCDRFISIQSLEMKTQEEVQTRQASKRLNYNVDCK